MFMSFIFVVLDGTLLFLFFSLILSEYSFSVVFLFCWFSVLSKFLFDFVWVSKSIEGSL